MTAMSASTKNGQALISVSNLDLDAEAHLQLDLRGLAVAEVSGRLLTADEPQHHNTDQAPTAVAPVPLEVTLADGVVSTMLPPHSFATLTARIAP